MPRTTLRSGAFAALALLVSAGCYKYAPIDPAELTVGSQARARVTLEQAATIGEITGSGDRVVAGEVVGLDDGSILLSVPTASVNAGLGTQLLFQRVNIPRTGIVEIETRRLDRARTGALVGIAAIAATYIVASQFIAADDPDGGGKPQPDQIVVPLFRFRH